ncbi:MAG TPA: cytochrome c3 family protein [Candidatus Saccharimonadales bacterium]|nr:cytochrome c3 family protein [Candidatus Saccharimonadales bacterium]
MIPRGLRERLGGRGAAQGWILTAGLIACLAVVAGWTSIEISSRPQFCGSCHIMNPYYESWKRSSHRNIACVECHIAPGVTAEFRKKYEALSMVVSYFTGTYSTNPWTEIDEAACLRCHERRLLAGKELFGDVLFDHSSHLAGLRRGKKLRCTSCHSQIVQGSHIAVTTSTCILCHFKGVKSNTGTARCTLCHHVPDKVIQTGTLTMNHADVERYGMECTWCHARPEGSDGAVPRERCVTCHNDPKRLEKYGETDFLHRMHVTEHKVDCMTCHLEIEHVSKPAIEKAAAACSTCHLKGHGPQMDLYSGVGGRGVEPIPDPMFLAGVRCEGCHIEVPGHETDTKHASELSCMSCHGPTYRKIFFSWKDGVRERTEGLGRQLSETTAALRGNVPASLNDARFNFNLVSSGHGVHNVRYSYALLDRAHDDMNQARTDYGLGKLPVPWTKIPYDSPCLQCHQGIEGQSGEFAGQAYSHSPHVLKQGIECTTCHRPHEERAKGEIVRYGPGGCVDCHHRSSVSRSCTSCHASIMKRTVKSFRGDFPHSLHVGEMGLECTNCHDVSAGGQVKLNKEFCAGCHED